MIKAIINFLTPMSDKDYHIWFLSQAVDHADLDRRMRILDRANIKSY